MRTRHRTPLFVALLIALGGSGLAAETETPFLLGPPADERPVPVRLGFYLNDVNSVEEEGQRFQVEGTLTLRWEDARLAFDPATTGVDEKVYQGDYQFSELSVGWWPQIVLANNSGSYERRGVTLRHRADGSMLYVEEISAAAEVPLQLKRFPFDRHSFELIFEVLGFSAEEVLLQPDPTTTGREAHGVSIAQWRLDTVGAASRDYTPVYEDGTTGDLSSVVISIEMTRRPGFMLRVVVFPLVLLVMLSWSVFWMNLESLGERMDISFVGILTAVAYLIMIGSYLPRISYFTLMGVFIYLSFVLMCCTVIINLWVGRLDRSGRADIGEVVDRRSRWLFPLAYVGLLSATTVYYLVRY